MTWIDLISVLSSLGERPWIWPSETWSTSGLFMSGSNQVCTHNISYTYRHSAFTLLLWVKSFLHHFLVLVTPRSHLHVVGMSRFTSGINQPSLPTPCYSVLVSVSLFVALSTLFHSINSPANSLFSHFVCPALSLPYWPFQLAVSLWKSPSALI